MPVFINTPGGPIMVAQASPGAGAIFYRYLSDNSLLVGCAHRTRAIGEGYGVTGGGFVECNDLLDKPEGTLLLDSEEAYRELCEEFPGQNADGTENAETGLRLIIPKEHFLDNVQPLTSFVVRKNDENVLHSASYFAYAVTQKELIALQGLPLCSERDKPLEMFVLSWPKNIDRATAHKQITLQLPARIFHEHEIRAFGELAWLASRKRLWSQN